MIRYDTICKLRKEEQVFFFFPSLFTNVTLGLVSR